MIQNESEIKPETFIESEYNPTSNIRHNSALLMEALSDLEGSIISVQDPRKSAKEKTALIEYFGTLLRCFDLSKRVTLS